MRASQLSEVLHHLPAGKRARLAAKPLGAYFDPETFRFVLGEQGWWKVKRFAREHACTVSFDPATGAATFDKRQSVTAWLLGLPGIGRIQELGPSLLRTS